MTSVILSGIPDRVSRSDILNIVEDLVSNDYLHYLLYPLGKDGSRAFAAFKTIEGSCSNFSTIL